MASVGQDCLHLPQTIHSLSPTRLQSIKQLRTFTRIYLHAKNGDPVKQAVKSSQRTEKTTKRPIDKQRRSSQKSNDPTPVQTMQIKEIQIAGKQQQNHIFKIT